MTSVVNEQVNPGGVLKSHPFSGSLQMHSMTGGVLILFLFCNGSGNCSAYNLNIRHLLYDGH